MKKLCIVSGESVFGGTAKSGVAEVTDSLACALAGNYAVTVVCPGRESIFSRLCVNQGKDGARVYRWLGVTYELLTPGSGWLETAAEVIGALEPDILHNFAGPELLGKLAKRPGRCVYTIDQKDFVKDKGAILAGYDAVTTVSEHYAAELLAGGDALAETLAGLDFRGITNGILTPVFAPEKGLLTAAKFSAEDQSGKAVCKARLRASYGIPGTGAVYLMMCRLVRDKGLDEVLEAVHTIRDSGGFVLFAGRGDTEYEARLAALTREDGALWLNRLVSPLRAVPLLAGADFYLSPSVTEPCGLMPMTACRYGCVPIVTLTGGLADNMDKEIAVLVGEDGVAGAIAQAAALYADQEALTAKRAACMGRDFSWATRKKGYLEVYEG